MEFDPFKPFNDLPDLSITTEIETKKILKKTISASRALAELKGAITSLPNPVLFVDTVQLQEAQASSAIENIVTTQDALFQAFVADKKTEDSATKEVILYKDALWFGVNQLNRKPLLTTNLFISLVQIIKENQSAIRKISGTQLKNPATGQIIYTPPDGERIIRNKLHALENFIHEENEIDPLIKMAMIHYQFEAIHPFYDGNGRTGRIILLLYLKHCGLMDPPALFLSKHILKNKKEYYKHLRQVTEKQNWEGWILFMLDMIEETANSGAKKIQMIEQEMEKMGGEIQKSLSTVYSKELMEILFRLPYSKRTFLVEAGLGNSKTAGNYLNKLETEGFLKSEMIGKEKLYLNGRLMQILKLE
jgi:Fic family protein